MSIESDWKDRWFRRVAPVFLLVITVLNLVDALTTLFGVGVLGGEEGNPNALQVISFLGLNGWALSKTVASLVVLGALWVGRKSWKRMWLPLYVVVTVASIVIFTGYVVIVIHNFGQLIG